MTIENTEDVIDSRDVIARFEALRTKELEASRGENTFDADESGELESLLKLAEQCEGYSADWEHGETLIRDSYFRRYAMELADDIGAINKDATWPNTCIDWDLAARELQMDYTAVDFDGVTHWIRG